MITETTEKIDKLFEDLELCLSYLTSIVERKDFPEYPFQMKTCWNDLRFTTFEQIIKPVVLFPLLKVTQYGYRFRPHQIYWQSENPFGHLNVELVSLKNFLILGFTEKAIIGCIVFGFKMHTEVAEKKTTLNQCFGKKSRIFFIEKKDHYIKAPNKIEKIEIRSNDEAMLSKMKRRIDIGNMIDFSYSEEVLTANVSDSFFSKTEKIRLRKGRKEIWDLYQMLLFSFDLSL